MSSSTRIRISEILLVLPICVDDVCWFAILSISRPLNRRLLTQERILHGLCTHHAILEIQRVNLLLHGHGILRLIWQRRSVNLLPIFVQEGILAELIIMSSRWMPLGTLHQLAVVLSKVDWVEIVGDFHGVVVRLLHTLRRSRHLKLHVTAAAVVVALELVEALFPIIIGVHSLIFEAIALEFDVCLVVQGCRRLEGVAVHPTFWPVVVPLAVAEAVVVSLIRFLDLDTRRLLHLPIPRQLIRRRRQPQPLRLQRLLRRVRVHQVRHRRLAVSLFRKTVLFSCALSDVTAVELCYLVVIVAAGITTTLLVIIHLVLAFRPLDIYVELLVAELVV